MKVDSSSPSGEGGAVGEGPADVVIRFAGDSGDGIQLLGGRFAKATALSGLDLATFPDFPAEIRAPAGTTYGVSAFQMRFGSERTRTSGDTADVLVALNPAALKVNLDRLKRGGVIIADQTAFASARNLKLAGYAENPLESGVLDGYRVLAFDITTQTLEVAKPLGLSQKEAMRNRNMWALGLVCWMFRQPVEATAEWLSAKFAKAPDLAGAAVATLKAGHAFGETAEISGDVAVTLEPRLKREPGTYRLVTGAEALSWGLAAGVQLAGLEMVLCSYPITPSSPVLHQLANMRGLGVSTFQAEDEIAAVSAALGASWAGRLGVTASSGPGVALKTETLGLAISAELPLIVVDTQRAGPSTGMPTKTEQSDLFIAVFGRNGDAPMPVVSASSPGDCFDAAIEAVRLAVKFMTPVFLMSDGYIANSAEPWRLPDLDALTPFPVEFHRDTEGFHPFRRDPDSLARVWAVPGTPGLEHRIGGIEKDYDSGHISYDPANHQRMTDTRMDKIARIAGAIPEQTPDSGGASGELAILAWGSTYGAVADAASRLRGQGRRVSHIHLRHLWPFPRNLTSLLGQFDHVLVPEMNTGQLLTLLRAQGLPRAEGLNKVTGQPFAVDEIMDAANRLLSERSRAGRAMESVL
ncbi:MAG: 2-oxoacid:acceptor oxidoreductase subunit alpha [Alphaproteobacteria bacterium]